MRSRYTKKRNFRRRRVIKRARRPTRVSRRSRRVYPTRKGILDVTSIKKSDSMMPTQGTSSTVAPNGYVTPAGTGAAFIFCPTYRYLEGATAGRSTFQSSARNATNTYAKGFSETILFAVNGGSPVRWRRVIFSTHLAPISSAFYASNTNDGTGYHRPMNPLIGTDYLALTTLIFTGVQNVDWNSVHDAQLDTSRITVHYDKKMVVNPGNASGAARVHKHYTSLNRPMIYGDDESGEFEASSPFSNGTNSSMGNLFVYDVFDLSIPDGVTQIGFNPQSKYYWHER